MKIDIFSKDPHDLYTTPLLQQTAYWSEVKSRLGFIPLAFELEVREKDLHSSLSSSVARNSTEREESERTLPWEFFTFAGSYWSRSEPERNCTFWEASPCPSTIFILK